MERLLNIMSDSDSGNLNHEENVGLNFDQVDDRMLNEALDLLQDHRQRYVLEKLQTTSNDVASLEDLVNYLLAHDPNADDADQVAGVLHHQTLPRLADTALIDFDPRTNTVRYHGTELGEHLGDFISNRND